MGLTTPALLVSALVSVGVVASPRIAAAQFPPDGPGRETFESVCGLCHAPAAVAGKLWTRPQWEAKVAEMLQEEPEVTFEERATIVEYLSSHFKPGGKIYINVVGAKDLATALQLSTENADAIVRYREEKGRYSAADDLKKIPGLDITKIAAAKDRLEFSKAR